MMLDVTHENCPFIILGELCGDCLEPHEFECSILKPEFTLSELLRLSINTL